MNDNHITINLRLCPEAKRKSKTTFKHWHKLTEPEWMSLLHRQGMPFSTYKDAWDLMLAAAGKRSIASIYTQMLDINRWGGGYCRHFNQPINLAQHTLMVACLHSVQPHSGGNLPAYMHDWHEATIGDIIAPVKLWMKTADTSLQKLEAAIDKIHYKALGLEYGNRDVEYSVKSVDRQVNLLEGDLMASQRKGIPTNRTAGLKWAAEWGAIPNNDLYSVLMSLTYRSLCAHHNTDFDEDIMYAQFNDIQLDALAVGYPSREKREQAERKARGGAK